MTRRVVPLALLAASCARAQAPSSPPDAQTQQTPHVAAAEGSSTADCGTTRAPAASEAGETTPQACADGGTAAWYLVSSCGPARLEWMTPDGPHLAPPLAGDDPLQDVRWVYELPDCGIVPRPRLRDVHVVRVTPDGDTVYQVKLESHEGGGMECRTWTSHLVTGTVVVDNQGALVRANLNRRDDVAVASSNPECGQTTTSSVAITVHRACSAS